jgi:hypothetical protein
MTTAKVIELVCQALTQGARSEASAIAREQYPFVRSDTASRRYTAYQMTRVFWRDGFTGRYSGERLVFPGTLRVLGAVLPEEFPTHPNWPFCLVCLLMAKHLAFSQPQARQRDTTRRIPSEQYSLPRWVIRQPIHHVDP